MSKTAGKPVVGRGVPANPFVITKSYTRAIKDIDGTFIPISATKVLTLPVSLKCVVTNYTASAYSVSYATGTDQCLTIAQAFTGFVLRANTDFNVRNGAVVTIIDEGAVASNGTIGRNVTNSNPAAFQFEIPSISNGTFIQTTDVGLASSGQVQVSGIIDKTFDNPSYNANYLFMVRLELEKAVTSFTEASALGKNLFFRIILGLDNYGQRVLLDNAYWEPISNNKHTTCYFGLLYFRHVLSLSAIMKGSLYVEILDNNLETIPLPMIKNATLTYQIR